MTTLTGNVVALGIDASSIPTPIVVVVVREGFPLTATAVAPLAIRDNHPVTPDGVVGNRALNPCGALGPGITMIRPQRRKEKVAAQVRNHQRRPETTVGVPPPERTDEALPPRMTAGVPLPGTTVRMESDLARLILPATRNVHVSVLTLLMNLYKYVNT
jgi:hypothetical protein